MCIGHNKQCMGHHGNGLRNVYVARIKSKCMNLVYVIEVHSCKENAIIMT